MILYDINGNVISSEEGTLHLDNRDLCEYSIIDTLTGNVSLSTSSDFASTDYIYCHGSSNLTTKMMVGTLSSQNYGITFYGASKNLLSHVNYTQGANMGSETVSVAIPSNAYYFRITYWNYENQKTYGKFTATYDAPSESANNKRPYQSGYIFYSAFVNQSVNNYWETSAQTELDEDIEPTTGVLALPESYKPTGKPTPIIMYFHGISHYVYYGTWGDTDTFRTQKQHWLSMGFAVMDCNGGRNNNMVGNYTSGGSRQYVDGYRKCWDYVKEHYNVDDKPFVVGGSAGGIPAVNYSIWYANETRALCLLSAWTNLKANSWDNNVKDTIVEYLGFANSTTYEESKTIGFDPSLRILTIGANEYITDLNVPVLVLYGSTEASNHIGTTLNRFVTALRNAGKTATIREISGATHVDVVSGGVSFIDTEVGNWFLSN